MPTPPILPPPRDGKPPWWKLEHPEVAALAGRWRYTRDHYEGEVFGDAAGQRTPYLVQKRFGEHDLAFEERLTLADYTNHFAAVVESLAGMLFAADEQTTRLFGDAAGRGLGTLDDPDAPIAALWRNADGKGTAYLTLWKSAAVELILFRRVWVYVDNLGDASLPVPAIRILPPEAVRNWIDARAGVREALIAEADDVRTSVADAATNRSRVLHVTRDGWRRYVIDDEARTATTGDGPEWCGEHAFRDPAGRPALPIFPVTLPLARNIGYLLARKANAIFNRESDRDHLIRVGSHPKLNLVARDELFEKLVASLNAGTSALQQEPEAGPHNYIAPPTGPADIGSKVLERKVEEFYTTAFREYGDAARQKTATEARQDVAHGVGAFLTLLAAALDQAETGALWRVAQVIDAADVGAAEVIRVERTNDFAAIDAEAQLDRLRERVFGKDRAVPLGTAGRIAAAKQVATYLGLEVDDAELAAAVETDALIGLLETADKARIPLPAEVRVEALRRLLLGNRLVAADGSATLEDGTPALSLDAILAEARTLAEADDESSRRASEGFGGGFGTPEPPPLPPAPPAPRSRRITFQRDAAGEISGASVEES